MVLPFAVDQQVIAGVALLLKAGAHQQRTARHIGRQAGGLDPVQPQLLESEIEHQRQCRSHKALARIWFAGPVAEAPRLRDAAADVGETETADERLVVAEDKEVVALIGPPILGIAGDAGAKAGPAQRVRRPARFPRRRKIAGTPPAAGPSIARPPP